MDYTDVNQMFFTYSYLGIILGFIVHLFSFYLGWVTTFLRDHI